MLADLMPRWLFTVLRMDSAKPSDVTWTWRHTCRYGFDVCPPTEASFKPRPTPWLFRDGTIVDRVMMRLSKRPRR